MEEVKTFRLSFSSLSEGRTKVVPFPVGMGKSATLFLPFLPEGYWQALEKAYLEAGVKNRSQRRQLVSIICSDRQRPDLFLIHSTLNLSIRENIFNREMFVLELAFYLCWLFRFLLRQKPKYQLFQVLEKKKYKYRCKRHSLRTARRTSLDASSSFSTVTSIVVIIADWKGSLPCPIVLSLMASHLKGLQEKNVLQLK